MGGAASSSTAALTVAGMSPEEFSAQKRQHRESPDTVVDPKLLLGPRNVGRSCRNGVDQGPRPALQHADRHAWQNRMVIGHVDGRPVTFEELKAAKNLHKETGEASPALTVAFSSYTAARTTGPLAGTSESLTVQW